MVVYTLLYPHLHKNGKPCYLKPHKPIHPKQRAFLSCQDIYWSRVATTVGLQEKKVAQMGIQDAIILTTHKKLRKSKFFLSNKEKDGIWCWWWWYFHFDT